MRRKYTVLIGVLLFATLVPAIFAGDQKPTLLVDADNRVSISLDGEWHAVVDPYDNGYVDFRMQARPDGYFLNDKPGTSNKLVEYDFAKSPTLKVPGDWNSQRDTLFLYEGTVWYEKDFQYQRKPNTRTFLHIGAANYLAGAFVNGKKACEHEGGFTPFDCEITSLVHDGGNFVVIRVNDQRRRDGVPTLNTDWWNYGGLTRDVSLIETPETFVDDYSLQLQRAADSTIAGWVHAVGASAGSQVTVKIPELNLAQTAPIDAQGRASFSLKVTNLQRWSPESPKLYDIEISTGKDHLKDSIGFRTIEVQGDNILLNGKPVFLRGVSIHAEAPYRSGRAWSEQDAETLLGWAKELGANFVRLAHYPHDERMTRLADRMGILVWSEVPVYWMIEWENPATLANATNQLQDMIRRDRNKASVILWSVANETPNTPARLTFLKSLIATARAEDPSRLVTAALLVTTSPDSPEGIRTKVIDDPLGEYLDVLGCNEYIGWYEGTPELAQRTRWTSKYNKPLIMSEFGGDAKFGLHGTPDQRWTEEYQESIYRQQIAMLKQVTFLRGISPWILMDFRSPRRTLPEIQDFYNRKGLISDQGQKKKAFFVLQEYYNSLASPSK
ncbi:MAG TPA: glycoside hydrolase family 2 TIM barrel-domain containing protein [Terriglobales bacterium]